MTVRGTDATIINDFRDRVAALEAPAERFLAECAEEDRVNAELAVQNAQSAATVKAQAARIADLESELAAAGKDSS